MKKIVVAFIVVASLIGVVSQLDFRKAGEGCAFCKKEVLASQVFYRGEQALGLLTHKPAVPGHVLIVPRRHVERFEQLSAEEMAEIQEVIQKVHGAVSRLYGATGYLLLQKNGREAGQSVPHVHFHYLPAVRFLAARFFISPWLKPLSEDAMRAVQKDLSESI